MNSEQVKKIILDFLENVPFQKTEIIVEEDSMLGCTFFNISTNDSRFLIGKDGDALQAINHVARRIIEKNIPESDNEGLENKASTIEFTIDVNGYQKKRIENIKAIAHMMAERARFFKASVSLEPMSAYERRIIHTYLEGEKNVTTESAGIAKDRHVVIKYTEE